MQGKSSHSISPLEERCSPNLTPSKAGEPLPSTPPRPHLDLALLRLAMRCRLGACGGRVLLGLADSGVVIIVHKRLRGGNGRCEHG